MPHLGDGGDSKVSVVGLDSVESGLGPRFLSNLAQELYTPLGSVLILSELMEDQAREGSVAGQRAAKIHQAASDLRILIDQVSLLARIQARRVKIERNRISIEAFARNLEAEAEERHQRVRVEWESNTPEKLLTDRQHLLEAILHLIAGTGGEEPTAKASAISFGPAPESGDGWMICIRRPARGIREEAMGCIFDPFCPSAQIVTRRYGGQSLDFTIARAFVLLLGGSLVAAAGEDEIKFSLLLHSDLTP